MRKYIYKISLLPKTFAALYSTKLNENSVSEYVKNRQFIFNQINN